MNNPFSHPAPTEEVRQFQVVDIETLTATRNLIQRKGRDLAKLKEKKKLLKEKEQSLLDNNQEFQDAEAAAQEHVDKVAEIKKKIKDSPEAARIRILKKEVAEEERELEEGLSGHLINYRGMTGGNVFETESGQELEFKTNGKFSPKQLARLLEEDEEGEDE